MVALVNAEDDLRPSGLNLLGPSWQVATAKPIKRTRGKRKFKTGHSWDAELKLRGFVLAGYSACPAPVHLCSSVRSAPGVAPPHSPARTASKISRARIGNAEPWNSRSAM